MINDTIKPEILSEIITNALNTTLDEKSFNESNNDPGKNHYSLSQNWVKYFALQIEASYNDKENIKAFYRDVNLKKKNFFMTLPLVYVKSFLQNILKTNQTISQNLSGKLNQNLKKTQRRLLMISPSCFQGMLHIK